MKRSGLFIVIGMLVGGFSGASWPPPPPWMQDKPEEKAAPEEEAAQEDIEIPRRWLRQDRGYEEAKELQEASGADIIMYIKRTDDSRTLGLCNWFERDGLQNRPVVRYLEDYIKVELTLPANRRTTEIAERYGLVGSGPILYVIRPNGWKNFVRTFNWPGGRPEPRSPAELIKDIRSQSSPRYQEEEDT